MQVVATNKTFKGGYFFRPFKGEIENHTVTIPAPRTAVIPMRQGYGVEVPVRVKVGDKVRAGTVLGRDDGSISTPAISPVSGVVKETGVIKLPGGESMAVLVESDGKSGWDAIPRNYTDYRSAGGEQIGKALYEAGVTSLGKWGLPTRHNTSAVSPETVQRIIITAVPAEPFILTNQVLLSNSLREFTIGCEILRNLYKPEGIHLAISDRDEALVQKMHAELADLKVSIHELSPKHPQSYEEIVIESCLGVSVPDRGRAIDAGVLVIDSQTVLHIHDAVVDGKPLIERMVALGGGAYSEPCAAIVTVGTPIKEVISGRLRDGVEPRIILDSSITGAQVEDLSVPVDRSVSAVLALEEFRERPLLHFVRAGADYDSQSNSFLGRITGLLRRSDTNLGGELRPCIKCEYCEEVCPRDLMPHLLSKCVKADLPEEAERIRIFGCIECGLCSYVCPSKIPLMDDIMTGKELTIKEEAEYRSQMEEAEEERRRKVQEQEAGEGDAKDA